jgi:hypothetical protein
LSAEEGGPVSVRCHEPRQCLAKVLHAWRLCRLNAKEAVADQANDRQSLVQLEVELEQREQHRRHVWRAYRRSSKKVVASQRDDQVKSKVHGKMSLDRIRHRVTINAYGSGRRRLWARLNKDNLAEVHRPDFISRSRVRLVANKRIKRASNKKECSALTLSLRRRSASSRRCRNNNNNEAAHLAQLSADKHKGRGSRKVGRGNQKKRHRQGRDNFVAIIVAASLLRGRLPA